MFFKKFKKTCLCLLLSLFIMPSSIFAYSDYVIVGGENIGIELKAKGIMVVGIYKVGSNYPANEAGIKVGDIITSINNEPVNNISELSNKINTRINDEIKIGYMRNDITNYTNLKLYKDNDIYKTGLYVKDSITGIGTLTFIDPNTKIFGALGHEIIERNTGKILEIKDGKISSSLMREDYTIEAKNDGIVYNFPIYLVENLQMRRSTGKLDGIYENDTKYFIMFTLKNGEIRCYTYSKLTNNYAVNKIKSYSFTKEKGYAKGYLYDVSYDFKKSGDKLIVGIETEEEDWADAKGEYTKIA